MRFDHFVTYAAFLRQRGRCAKCGKYLNQLFQDKEKYDGSWTAHDLVSFDEGGGNKAYNCVILCITKPNCHLDFAHGGDPSKHVFLSQYAFPNWIVKSDTGQAQ